MTYQEWCNQMMADRPNKPAAWREGQWWYNRLHEVRPDLTQKVWEEGQDGKSCDPFYQDKNLDAFHTFLSEKWQ